jgi:hypothetical protein
VLNGFNSKRWSISLLIIGFFYALFGIFRLKVWLDTGLLAANIILLIQVIGIKKELKVND